MQRGAARLPEGIVNALLFFHPSAMQSSARYLTPWLGWIGRMLWKSYWFRQVIAEHTSSGPSAEACPAWETLPVANYPRFSPQLLWDTQTLTARTDSASLRRCPLGGTEESYRVWCVWVCEASIMRRPWPTRGFCAMEKKNLLRRPPVLKKYLITAVTTSLTLSNNSSDYVPN
jgi:hypothetical protein